MSFTKIALPSSDFVFSVMLRLLQLSIVKYRLSTPFLSWSWPRVISPRPGSSTLMTSAPSQPKICVHDGPAWTCVMSRILMPSSAFATGFPFTFAIRGLLVHRLVHRARRELVGIDPHVDQRALARSACTLQRRLNFLGIAHGLTVSAEHLRELLEINVAQIVADVALFLTVLHDLSGTNLVHVRVVADDADERQVEAHGGLHIPARHTE